MSTGKAICEITFCNALPHTLSLWLEPWAEEFSVPAGSVATIRCSADEPDNPTPEIESPEGNMLTIWGAGGSCVAIHIDGVDQDAFSAGYPAPDFGALTTRHFVNLVFDGHPEARPGGLEAPPPSRLKRWRQRLFPVLR